MINDKKLHFWIAYGLIVALSYIVDYKRAIAIVITLMFGKEAHDRYIKKTHFSMPDIYAGARGVLFGLITYSIIEASRKQARSK